MGPGPGRRSALVFRSSAEAGLEVAPSAQGGEHGGRRGGIVAGSSHVADAELVALIFLTARVTQSVELGALRCDLGELAGTGHRTEHERAQLGQDIGPLALRAVAGGDMARL